MLSHSGCFRISSIISEINSAVVFLGLVVIIHLCKRISPAQHWSLHHLGASIPPSRHFFVSSLSSALPIAGSVVKDGKKTTVVALTCRWRSRPQHQEQPFRPSETRTTCASHLAPWLRFHATRCMRALASRTRPGTPLTAPPTRSGRQRSGSVREGGVS